MNNCLSTSRLRRTIFRVSASMFLLFPALFSFSAAGQEKIDYANPQNWVLYTPADRADKLFDVFYLYPTLTADEHTPLMPWDKKTKDKVIPFAKAQTSGLAPYANLYSPYVRQLEFGRCIRMMKCAHPEKLPPEETIETGVRDTMEAFQYYLTHLNRGRPYILFSHSQGTQALAIVLATNKNISVERGFVAAYLIGMTFRKDAPLPFAKGAEDLGVVITWNTQAKGAKNPLFSGPGSCCINPLNWKTDSTPALKEENPGAMFYDYKTGKSEHIPRFCGATADPENGILIVDLPPESKWIKRTLFGKQGVYHENDIWFFYDSLIRNIRLRVENWCGRYLKK